ncbi:MAG TPA: pyridoxamine 5'-phosphate oxidase family protein [Candidatus Limnocylindrales bacterium]|jgi:PPOX class probable F420-dependent enzyme
MSGAGSHTTLSARALLFLRPARFATLATINADGSPHQTVVWYLLRDGGSGPELVINSLVGRRWPANLRRDARCGLVVEDGLDYISISALADEDPDAQHGQADIAAMARRYEEPLEAERLIAVRFRPQRRVSFVLHPTRVHEHWEGSSSPEA